KAAGAPYPLLAGMPAPDVLPPIYRKALHALADERLAKGSDGGIVLGMPSREEDALPFRGHRLEVGKLAQRRRRRLFEQDVFPGGKSLASSAVAGLWWGAHRDGIDIGNSPVHFAGCAKRRHGTHGQAALARNRRQSE